MEAAIKALVAAQSEMTAANKGRVNPAFRTKYATLSDVMDACLPALRNHGFAVLQPMGRDELGPYVETHLCHESGPQFSSRVYLIVGKNDMQGFGSAVTYARRYGLAALAGITDTDDDGNAAAKSRQRAPERSTPTGAQHGQDGYGASVEPAHDEDGVITPPTRNPAQAATDGLRDAWLDGVRDSLPADYSPKQFYDGCADALIAAFALKKSASGVQAQWDKRDGLIMEMQDLHPVAYHRVMDAYNDRMRAFGPAAEMIAAGTFGG